MKLLKDMAAISLASAFLAGCFSTDSPATKVVDGGTIETTNGLVLLPDGRPAARTKIYAVDENAWFSKVKSGNSVVLDSTETNDSGRFTLKRDTSSNKQASLMTICDGHGIFIRHYTSARIKGEFWGVIVLHKNVSYRGKVMDGGTVEQDVFLAGTPFSGEVGSDGSFSIPNLPPEKYPVVVRRRDSDQGEQYLVAGVANLIEKDSVAVPESTLVPDISKTLLVEDFEDSDNRNKLGPILGGGYWDAQGDAYLLGDSRLTLPVNAAPANFAGAIGDGNAPGREKSLQVLYLPGTGNNREKPYSFVYVEANIGTIGDRPHVNLSMMDSLTFFAKGNGSLVVEFVQTPEGIGAPVDIRANAQVTLTEAWQLFKITPESLKVEAVSFPDKPEAYASKFVQQKLPAYAAKPTNWSEMGGMARSIRFMGTGGTEFRLDDIKLHGLVLDDLLK